MSVFKIIPTTQQYDWGKTGRGSKVAEFAEASKVPGFAIDEAAPYAELWMGTHPKSPSRVASSQQDLAEYLAAHPELIGQEVIEKFDAGNGNLPFLFKVLSIEKALSIQSHPDKKTAEQLHAAQPDIYKDPNHKPEMALAITPFQALCGFRPLPEIASYLTTVPELSALLPPLITSSFLSIASSSTPTGPTEKAALRDLFAALMTADPADIKRQVDLLLARYNAGKTNAGEDVDVVKLVMRLDAQFPGDAGIFCPFVLNYVFLQPGDAIFLGAGEPHAYISGECIECMANSDNVIRAGLTPKLRDIPNLVSGLTYISAKPTAHVVDARPFTPTNASTPTATPTPNPAIPTSPSPSESNSTLYDPPIPEFSVVQVCLEPSETEQHAPLRGPSIAIVTEGGAKVKWGEGETLDVSLGDVFFVGADTPVSFSSTQQSELTTIYRAFVEVN